MNKTQAKKLKNKFKENYFVRNGNWEGFVHIHENKDKTIDIFETAYEPKKCKTFYVGSIIKGSIFAQDDYVLNIDDAEYIDIRSKDPYHAVEMHMKTYDAYVKVDNLIQFIQNKYNAKEK